jgi:ABC-type polysaccharide/polyol phosphate transport system ATPase subunit
MPSDREPAITVTNASKRYFLNRTEPVRLTEFLKRPRRTLRLMRGQPFWAVRDVSFDVGAGEVLGIIGANGSGKSTLLRMLLGISPPTTGTVTINGSAAGLLELGAGFHPDATGRENVILNGMLMGLKKEEIKRRLPEIVEFAGLEAFIDQPTRTYSTGMHVRLGFSVAVHLSPDILLVDEVLAVGDAEFQEKCYAHFRDLRSQGKTIVLVSHDMVSIRNFADRVLLLSHGSLVAEGAAIDVVTRYLLEYQQRSEAAERFFDRGIALMTELQAHALTQGGQATPDESPDSGSDPDR